MLDLSVLKQSLREKDYSKGIEHLKNFESDSWKWVCNTDYSLYTVALFSHAGLIDQALKKLKEAHEFGYRRFWRFNPTSHGWGKISDDDPHGIFENHRFLVAFYRIPEAIVYVEECLKSSAWKSYEPETTPFIWAEKKLRKDQEVYQFRFFSGSKDSHSTFSSLSVSESKSNEAFLRNLDCYENNRYRLEDFNYHTDYSHPLINQFWKKLPEFDLDKVLELIANPPVSPTPYVLTDLSGNESYGERDELLSGTGGEFLNLLWILIKTGHLPEIVKRLPQLPDHMMVTLLLFDHDVLALPELRKIYPLLYKEKLSQQEILSLIRFGQAHPDFQRLLAASLNLYEYHLYSNYHPGANWFAYDFRHLRLARGSRYLYLLGSRYELLDSLRKMKSRKVLPSGLRHGAWDAYDNSGAFLTQALILGLKLEGSPEFSHWVQYADKQTTKLLTLL